MDPVALTRQLIDIPSVTGDESAVARFLGGELRALGYRVELLEAAPGRHNVLATTGAPAHIVFSTHLDTVPPPIPSREDAEYVYGRGACDAKGIVAAQVAAAQRLRAEGLDTLGLLFVVDEEMESVGARAANEYPVAAECRYLIDGEPTDNTLVVATKGSLRLTLCTTGTGGHSSAPEGAVSAIDRLLEVLMDLRRAEWPRDPVLGRTTLNIGVIAGGTRPNVIATEARADLQIRLAAAADAVRRRVAAVVAQRAAIDVLTALDPVRLTAVDGFAQSVVPFMTDIPHLTRWGTPLLLGPGSIADAHSAGERMSKRELERGTECYVRLARTLAAGIDS